MICLHLHSYSHILQTYRYAVTMFSDKNSGVRATSLRVLTKLLRGIKSLPIQELALFPEYLLPGLETLLSESSEENVLLAMAECLPSLAQTAKFFLELAHAERTLLLSSRKSQLQYERSNNTGTVSFVRDRDGARSQAMRWKCREGIGSTRRSVESS